MLVRNGEFYGILYATHIRNEASSVSPSRTNWAIISWKATPTPC
jgi:hypothetical protein